jgi:TetR/AcrR family transcriptional regulator
MAKALEKARKGRPRDENEPPKILAAAERLFSLHGFDGTSLRKVASQWGGTHVGVLHYFPSKRQLYGAVLERIGKSLESLVAAAVNTPGDERDKVLRLFEQAFDWHVANPQWTRIILRDLVDNPSRASSIRRWVFADAVQQMSQMVASGSERGLLREVDPLLVLMHLFGAAAYFIAGLPTIAALADHPAHLLAEHYRREARRYAELLLVLPDRPARLRRRAR